MFPPSEDSYTYFCYVILVITSLLNHLSASGHWAIKWRSFFRQLCIQLKIGWYGNTLDIPETELQIKRKSSIGEGYYLLSKCLSLTPIYLYSTNSSSKTKLRLTCSFFHVNINSDLYQIIPVTSSPPSFFSFPM